MRHEDGRGPVKPSVGRQILDPILDVRDTVAKSLVFDPRPAPRQHLGGRVDGGEAPPRLCPPQPHDLRARSRPHDEEVRVVRQLGRRHARNQVVEHVVPRRQLTNAIVVRGGSVLVERRC